MNTIVLTNTNAGTESKSKLTLILSNPMRLDDCLVCMSDLAIYYSWYNIKATYKNNKFSYKRLSDNKIFEIELPDGSYEIDDVNDYLHETMKENGDEPDDKVYGIELIKNRVYNRCTIVVNDKYELQLPSEGFNEFLGFKETLKISNKALHGDSIPKIDDVESVLVHCSLVNNRHQPESKLIYSFTPNKAFGNLLNIKPSIAQWRSSISGTEVYEISIWFTNQNNIPLDNEDPTIKVEIQIMDRTLLKLL